MTGIDTYIREVIEIGDEGSDLLRARTAPTLSNSDIVQVVEGAGQSLAVLRIPEDHYVVVHSIGGDPNERNPERHAASLVDKLVAQAGAIDGLKLTPVAFSNVIDSRTGDISLIEGIAGSLVERANHHGLAIMTGENAILGERVSEHVQANVMGTMMSLLPKSPGFAIPPDGTIKCNGNVYGVFDSAGRAVFINSDGIGTKTEFYERLAKTRPRAYGLGWDDFAAMNLDDGSKIGATARVISGVVETSGNISFELIDRHASAQARIMKITSILQHEDVGDRMVGYTEGVACYNMSGSVVSTINENRLRNPLKPEAGEYVVAIAGKQSNPRSNGITSKRETMVRLFGEHWHEKEIGKIFLEYLAAPSIILSPIFDRLISSELATSVYHMSGGAFNGKLAKPLARHGLFVRLEGLFKPDWRELALAGASFTSAEVAYAKWPMGNDGFVTTGNLDETMNMIRNDYRLRARVVGCLKEATDGRTGVELVASNEETVYYSGK